jgi:hypothetical protein
VPRHRLPDLAGESSGLLLWASHYPALSMASRLRSLGLRYSGDLDNLPDVQAVIGRFGGPVLDGPGQHWVSDGSGWRRA